jgi:hypothetical protein
MDKKQSSAIIDAKKVELLTKMRRELVNHNSPAVRNQYSSLNMYKWEHDRDNIQTKYRILIEKLDKKKSISVIDLSDNTKDI